MQERKREKAVIAAEGIVFLYRRVREGVFRADAAAKSRRNLWVRRCGLLGEGAAAFVGSSCVEFRQRGVGREFG